MRILVSLFALVALASNTEAQCVLPEPVFVEFGSAGQVIGGSVLEVPEAVGFTFQVWVRDELTFNWQWVGEITVPQSGDWATWLELEVSGFGHYRGRAKALGDATCQDSNWSAWEETGIQPDLPPERPDVPETPTIPTGPTPPTGPTAPRVPTQPEPCDDTVRIGWLGLVELCAPPTPPVLATPSPKVSVSLPAVGTPRSGPEND